MREDDPSQDSLLFVAILAALFFFALIATAALLGEYEYAFPEGSTIIEFDLDGNLIE